MIVGCVDRSVPSPSGGDLATPPPVSASPDDGALFLPTHTLTALPTALLTGVLQEQDGCLLAEGRDPRDLALRLVIWPSGTHAESSDGVLAVFLPTGFIRVGGVFHAGGGEYSDRTFIESLIGKPIPDRCLSATYWLVGGLAGPLPTG